MDDYEPEKAWKSAVSQRKYLLDKLLEDYGPPELSSEKVDDDEQEQETGASESDDAVEQEGGGDDDADQKPVPAKRKQIRPNFAF